MTIKDRAPNAPEIVASALRLSARVLLAAFWESLDWISVLALLFAAASVLLYALASYQAATASPDPICAAQALEHLSRHCPVNVDAMPA